MMAAYYSTAKLRTQNTDAELFAEKESLLKYVFKYHYGNALWSDLRSGERDECIPGSA